VLLEPGDLADFIASEAHRPGTTLMPSFIAGERVQYIAVGTVDGVVDFTGISATHPVSGTGSPS
jgi:hypothetical protein